MTVTFQTEKKVVLRKVSIDRQPNESETDYIHRAVIQGFGSNCTWAKDDKRRQGYVIQRSRYSDHDDFETLTPLVHVAIR